MDPREYVDARWSALVRAAVMLGAPEAEAPEIVQRVLADNNRRIKRADDPDPLVHRALAAAIPQSGQTRFAQEQDLEARREMFMDALEDVAPAPVGPAPATTTPPRARRWRLVAASRHRQQRRRSIGLDGPARTTTRPSDDRLRADQVPSLFGYDAAAARALLDERGLRGDRRAVPLLRRADRVIATDPVVGTTYSRGDPITVYTAVPTDVACLTNYSDIETAWRLLDFAHGRGTRARLRGPGHRLPRGRPGRRRHRPDGPRPVGRHPGAVGGPPSRRPGRARRHRPADVRPAEPAGRTGPRRRRLRRADPPVTAPDEALTFVIRAPGRPDQLPDPRRPLPPGRTSGSTRWWSTRRCRRARESRRLSPAAPCPRPSRRARARRPAAAAPRPGRSRPPTSIASPAHRLALTPPVLSSSLSPKSPISVRITP